MGPSMLQSVSGNYASHKQFQSLDLMKINQWQLSLLCFVSGAREIPNQIASIFKIKVSDLKMEIITLQTLMVQLKERLAQPDC